MTYTFWHRITRFFSWQRTTQTPLEEKCVPTLAEVQTSVTEEFRGLRKILRKQTHQLEELRARLTDPVPTPAGNGTGAGLTRLASTFFHLEQSLQEQLIDSPQRREAVSLFWLQLEQMLDGEDIHIIREQGVAFNPRLHRAVLARHPGVRNSVVIEVLEPGFMEHGKVRKPAKVILGSEENQLENPADTDQAVEHTDGAPWRCHPSPEINETERTEQPVSGNTPLSPL